MQKTTCLLLILLISACTASAGVFTNGGFEDGNFNGWTTGAGVWGYLEGPTVAANYLPGGSKYDSTINLSTVVGPGWDPIAGGQNLPTVYSGAYSARINDASDNYHVSVISQTVTNYTDPAIYFAWAAVLESAHNSSESSHFQLTLEDLTDNAVLIDRQYNSTDNGTIFQLTGNWYWTPWQVEQLTITPALAGHDFRLTLLASDCDQGGHGGYAYLDGFGAQIPVGDAPEPSTWIMAGLGLAGLAIRKLRR